MRRCPPQLTVRELRVRVRDKTKRVRDLVDRHDACWMPRPTRPRSWGACSASGGTRNWICVSLKTEMQMEMLRTKSPEMVRKEVAMHLLAYNLIRGIMAEAARVEQVKPRRLSFTGVVAYDPSRSRRVHLYDPARIEADLPRLLELIGEKRVGDRPDRYEPRAVKRRPKPHPLLRMPRRAAKRLIKRGQDPL